jgi:hypothetical protein
MDWQESYFPEEPIKLKAGTRLTVTARSVVSWERVSLLTCDVTRYNMTILT